jgi:hypothetical protein
LLYSNLSYCRLVGEDEQDSSPGCEANCRCSGISGYGLAAMQAPLEAYRRGVGLSEGYAYSKAREDQILSDARRNTGALGTASELIGGGWPVEDLLMRA